MAGSAGPPEAAEYDEDLKVVSAMRILTDEDSADPSKRQAAEREARAAAEEVMAARDLDYNDTPQGMWLKIDALSGGPSRGHSFDSVRVRSVAP